MVLVAPGITRFTVNAELAGQKVANILDMQVDTTGGTASRSEANFAIAGDIMNNWDDHIATYQSQELENQSVTWLDLDTEDGDLGERVSTSDTSWPANGRATGAPMPGGVAYLVKKQIVGTRGRRSGRMYLAGATEDATPVTSVNTLLPATVTGLNAELASFLDGINDAEGAQIGVQRQLVVVHTRLEVPGGEPQYNGYTPVESLTVDTILGTQRRRQR